MEYQEFVQSLEKQTPPKITDPLLLALWYDAKDNWQKAHSIAQDISSPKGSWMHAYLHRKEGDFSNAGYWYSRAGKKMPACTLEMEWEEIAKELL
jgi:hypothetical protein